MTLINQVFMRSDTDCEIPAVANACNLPYEAVEQYHDTLNGDMRDNINGSPYHIQHLLTKLNKGWKVVTDDDILSGTIDISKVILLVHAKESPYLLQHWCNVLAFDQTSVILLWNYPGQAMKKISIERFRALYRDGWPNCAYEVTEIPVKMSLFARFWVWITGLFA